MLYLCQLLSLRGAHYCGEGEEFGLGATFVDWGSCSAKRAIRITARDRLTCISRRYYSLVARVEGFTVVLKNYCFAINISLCSWGSVISRLNFTIKLSLSFVTFFHICCVLLRCTVFIITRIFREGKPGTSWTRIVESHLQIVTFLTLPVNSSGVSVSI